MNPILSKLFEAADGEGIKDIVMQADGLDLPSHLEDMTIRALKCLRDHFGDEKTSRILKNLDYVGEAAAVTKLVTAGKADAMKGLRLAMEYNKELSLIFIFALLLGFDLAHEELADEM